MKVNYRLDENHYIVSFTSNPFDSSKPFIEITDNDFQYLMTGKCQICEGKLDINKAVAELNGRQAKLNAQTELETLYAWFKYYDEQASQYARHMRLHGESDVDIVTLDALAEEKATRITELKALLK